MILLSGLFFGKRGHPSVNSLMFGKRSGYDSYDESDARDICRAVQVTCAKYGYYDL